MVYGEYVYISSIYILLYIYIGYIYPGNDILCILVAGLQNS